MKICVTIKINDTVYPEAKLETLTEKLVNEILVISANVLAIQLTTLVQNGVYNRDNKERGDMRCKCR